MGSDLCKNKIEINIIHVTKLKVDPDTKQWYIKDDYTKVSHAGFKIEEIE